MRRIFDFIAILISLTCSPLHGAELTELGPGDYDPDYGDQALRSGTAIAPQTRGEVAMKRLLEDAFGNLLLLSSTCTKTIEPTQACSIRITRLLANGSVDMTFNDGTGEIVVEDGVYTRPSAIVDASGVLWLTFSEKKATGFEHRRMKFGINGRLEGQGGSFSGSYHYVPLDAEADDQGRVYMLRALYGPDWQFFAFQIVRYNDGLDMSFNENIYFLSGGAVGELYAVSSLMLDSQYRPWIRGYDENYDTKLIRLQANGNLDVSFADDGVLNVTHVLESTPRFLGLGEYANAWVQRIELDSQDRPIVSGGAYWDSIEIEWASLWRLTEDGNIDVSFGPDGDGWFVTEMAWAMESIFFLSSNDHIVFQTGDFYLLNGEPSLRFYLQPDGLLDSDFHSAEAPWFRPYEFLGDAIFRDDGSLHVASSKILSGENRAENRVAVVQRYLGRDEQRSADLLPDVFSVPDEINAEPGELFEFTFTTSGVDAAVPVDVTGHGFLKTGDGAWRNPDYWKELVPPDTDVTVRYQASNQWGKMLERTLTVGELEVPIRTTTRSQLPGVEPFVIPAVIDALPGEIVLSEPIQPAGFVGDVAVSISGCQYQVEDNGWTVVDGSVSVGQSIIVRNQAGSWGETVSCTLAVGDQAAAFVVTTQLADTVPEPLPLPERIEKAAGTVVELGPYAISGINIPIQIGNSGLGDIPAEFLAEGSNEEYADVVTVEAGDRVRLRFTAPEAGTSGTVSIHVMTLANVQTVQVVATLAEAGEPQMEEHSGGGLVCPWLLAILAGFLGVRGRRQSRHFH